MTEQWKMVEGTGEGYEVSSLGRVRSLPKVMTTWTGTKWTRPEKLLSPSPDTAGYMRVMLMFADGKRAVKVHRLVAKAFVSGDKTLTVNHINGDKSRNEASNLEWCSQQENNIHAIRMGLIKSNPGSLNGNSKLTEEDVSDVRVLLSFGATATAIAKAMGVSHKTIYNILTGSTWRHA